MLLNNGWVKNEIKEEIKEILQTRENELHNNPNSWDKAKAFLRGRSQRYRPTKKNRNTSNNQPNTPPTRIQRTTTKRAHRKEKEGNNQHQRRIKRHKD